MYPDGKESFEQLLFPKPEGSETEDTESENAEEEDAETEEID